MDPVSNFYLAWQLFPSNVDSHSSPNCFVKIDRSTAARRAILAMSQTTYYGVSIAAKGVHMTKAWSVSDIRPRTFPFARPGAQNGSDTVAGLVSNCFQSYARVFHPAYRRVTPPSRIAPASWEAVRWGSVAASLGTVAYPAMEWEAVSSASRSALREPVWDKAPSVGTLPLPETRLLMRVLEVHTGTPADCYFAFAEARGLSVPPLVARIVTSMGPMVVFEGGVWRVPGE